MLSLRPLGPPSSLRAKRTLAIRVFKPAVGFSRLLKTFWAILTNLEIDFFSKPSNFCYFFLIFGADWETNATLTALRFQGIRVRPLDCLCHFREVCGSPSSSSDAPNRVWRYRSRASFPLSLLGFQLGCLEGNTAFNLFFIFLEWTKGALFPYRVLYVTGSHSVYNSCNRGLVFTTLLTPSVLDRPSPVSYS